MSAHPTITTDMINAGHDVMLKRGMVLGHEILTELYVAMRGTLEDAMSTRIATLEAHEEGAKVAFGHVVEAKRQIMSECQRLQKLLESAHDTIKRLHEQRRDAGVLKLQRDGLRNALQNLEELVYSDDERVKQAKLQARVALLTLRDAADASLPPDKEKP